MAPLLKRMRNIGIIFFLTFGVYQYAETTGIYQPEEMEVQEDSNRNEIGTEQFNYQISRELYNQYNLVRRFGDYAVSMYFQESRDETGGKEEIRNTTITGDGENGERGNGANRRRGQRRCTS